MKINGAWAIEQLPQHYVVELEDGSLAKFFVSPFRALSEAELTDYKGYHPRKCKGMPMGDYLYRFYGLEKSEESATEVIHIRLTPGEKTKIDAAAKNDDKTISEYVREWIRTK